MRTLIMGFFGNYASVMLAAFFTALLINIFHHDFFNEVSRRPIEKISLAVYSFFAQVVLTGMMLVTINAWVYFILKNTPLSDDWIDDLVICLMAIAIVNVIGIFLIYKIKLYVSLFFESLQKKLNE